MLIYIRCSNCKTDQSMKNKVCKRCGEVLPRQAKTYRVVVKHQGKTVTQNIPFSLKADKNIERKIKLELIEGTYFNRRKRIPTLDEVWVRYLEWAKENKKSWRDDKYRYDYLLKKRFGNKVFPGKVGKMRKEFKTAWKTIKTLAKLPQQFRFHGLRHVYASLLASSGQVNPYTLQKLLTHKGFKTTQRYSHLLEKSFKESAEVMDNIIDRVKSDNTINVSFGAKKV